MKIFIPLIVYVIFATVPTFGQNSRYELGIEGGPSLIDMWGNMVIDVTGEMAVGFAGGISIQKNINEHISLRTSVLFERKGFAYDGERWSDAGHPPDVEEEVGQLHLNYLVMPLLVRVTAGKSFRWYANGGVYLGYLVESYNVVEPMSKNQGTSVEDVDGHSDIDIGLAIGAGIKIAMTDRLLLSFEVRENLGLHNISEYAVRDDGAVRTNSTNLLLGITVPLGIKQSDP